MEYCSEEINKRFDEALYQLNFLYKNGNKTCKESYLRSDDTWEKIYYHFTIDNIFYHCPSEKGLLFKPHFVYGYKDKYWHISKKGFHKYTFYPNGNVMEENGLPFLFYMFIFLLILVLFSTKVLSFPFIFSLSFLCLCAYSFIYDSIKFNKEYKKKSKLSFDDNLKLMKLEMFDNALERYDYLKKEYDFFSKTNWNEAPMKIREYMTILYNQL